MRKISSFVIVAGTILIATGVGVWIASTTNRPTGGVKAVHVEDFRGQTPADGAPPFKP